MTLRLWALTAVFVVFAGAWLLDAWTSRFWQRIKWLHAFGCFLGLAAVGALRWWSVTPTLLHANLHGAPLVDAILAFPSEALHRATFGQFSFLALGALTRLIGRDVDTLFAINHVLGVVALGLAGWVAQRWTSRPLAFWIALSLGAFAPGLIRVAASEDAHTLGLVLGLSALLAFDVFASTQRLSALVAGSAALILLVHTRQTFYLWVPGTWAMLHVRAPAAWRRREVRAAALLTLLAMIQRVFTTTSDATEQTTVFLLPLMVIKPALLFALLRHHPLLDVMRYGPTLLLAVLLGLLAARQSPGWVRGLAWVWAAYFVLTVPFGLEIAGVEMLFRQPILAWTILLGAVGTVHAIDHMRARWPAIPRAALPLTLLLIAGAPRLTPIWGTLSEVSTDLQEYRFITDMLPQLPRRVLVLEPPNRDPLPAYEPPLGLLRRAGLDVHTVAPADLASLPSGHPPVVFFEGVACHGYAQREGSGFRSRELPSMSLDEIAQIMLGLMAHETTAAAADVPQQPRALCQALTQGAERIAQSAVLHPVQDLPFVVYPADGFRASIWILRN